MSFKKFMKRGFTLVELMIVVAIIGILAALAIYGVRRYIANSKTGEATSSLGAMRKGLLAHWEEEGMAPSVLGLGASAEKSQQLCASAANPVPANLSDVGGRKYQSAPSEWSGSAETAVGWGCMRFSMESPQYFQYDYQSVGGSDPGNTYSAYAYGDLDGDGNASTFASFGAIQQDSTTGDVILTPAPTMYKNNADE